MSSDGGLTWSNPIKINLTPSNSSEGNEQAFTPSVAVNSDGTVAVTYYDFRNNTAAAGVPTDYWLIHADSAFTNPASWASDEKRLTDSSFNMTIAPNSRGNFLGDYQGLSAAGTSFYALFGQAGTDASNNSNIWFRDPPRAGETAAGTASAAGTLPMDELAALWIGAFDAPKPQYAAAARSPVIAELPAGMENLVQIGRAHV